SEPVEQPQILVGTSGDTAFRPLVVLVQREQAQWDDRPSLRVPVDNPLMLEASRADPPQVVEPPVQRLVLIDFTRDVAHHERNGAGADETYVTAIEPNETCLRVGGIRRHDGVEV